MNEPIQSDIDIKILEFIEEDLNKMYRIAYWYTRDFSRAKDLVHDAILSILTYPNKSKIKSLPNFTYRAITNSFFQSKRKQNRVEIIELDVNESKPKNSDSLYSVSKEDVFFDSINDIRCELGDQLNLILDLKLEGKSIREISDNTGLSQRTINNRIAKIKRVIYKIVNKKWKTIF